MNKIRNTFKVLKINTSSHFCILKSSAKQARVLSVTEHGNRQIAILLAYGKLKF